MIKINLTLPIYYTFPEKVRKIGAKKGEIIKATTILISNNSYFHFHFIKKAILKEEYKRLVGIALKENKHKIEGKYKVNYTMFYKNKRQDLLNTASLISKFLNDTLIELKIIVDDSVQYCVEENFKVGGQDKTNPRIEIEIIEIDDF
ncbi:MAG: hypothetical protein ACRC0V_05095 [Fusobacteriaceae bacterium]